MKMERRYLKIGELAHQLGVESSVIRFWEKEFALAPKRSEGKQRCYTDHEVATFSTIKELLHVKKFTIAGARVALEELKKNRHNIPAYQKKAAPVAQPTEPIVVPHVAAPVAPTIKEEMKKELLSLRERLQKLQGML